jgi:hypothetical protein
MRNDKIISLLIALLIPVCSLTTQCCDNASQIQEIHFVAQPCSSHDCDRHDKPHGCTSENCQHKICSDQSALGEYVSKNQVMFEAVLSAPEKFVDLFLLPGNKTFSHVSFLIPPLIPDRHSTVLRI